MADLVFDPTLAGRKVCSSPERPTRLLSALARRPVLLLERAMLAGLCPGYVDRFARVWHRLATTDPEVIIAIIDAWHEKHKLFLHDATIFANAN
ncbi:MAG: hypothetical protein PHY12_11805 [Eubacteriales bacterium]|nr:hypothetical protein [Eubacteriales bacterium]